MHNILYSEFSKLKRSYMLIILFISTLFVPVFMMIISLSNNYSGISDVLRKTLIKEYRTNIEISCFQFLYIILFSLLAGYIFSREFTDKTANILYTYTASRIKIFFGKLIVVYILILLTYIMQFFSTYITMYIVWHELPSKSFIITDIKVNLYSSLLQFIWIPIPVLLASVSKNITFPVVYGVLGVVSSTFITMTGIYMQSSPLILSSLPVYYFYRGDPIDYVLSTSSAVITFVIFLGACLYHCNKIDIN